MELDKESRIIGKDSWWDTKLQEFKPRRFDLKKVPLKFRCPNCGKIGVKPEDRKPMRVVDKEDRRAKNIEIDRLMKLEKPTREEFDDFCKRHKELFTPLIHLVERTPSHRFSSYGGVCQDCWLDGFGRHGDYGGFVGSQIKPEAEKRRVAQQKWDKEKLEKYGEEPQSWVKFRWIENPEWRAWYLRKLEIDKGEKRKKNATFVESQIDVIK